jgi:protein ImuB
MAKDAAHEDTETWRTIGQELMRTAGEKQLRVHVAIAGTRVAALVLARARPGLTVVPPGREAAALAAVPLDVLAHVADEVLPSCPRTSVDAQRRHAGREPSPQGDDAAAAKGGVDVFKQWALRTLGEVAALPTADLLARLGRPALLWQAIARGADVRPLVPTEPEERFEQSLELEWPIEGLEPLSFVLTRLLEPLSTQLERRDRGAAVVHIRLDLVSRDVHARHLQLPSPLRDVRTLRTLIVLDIEAHPPGSAVDRVTIVIDPTPGRVVQHTLFTRALPTPERLSTLLARLAAVLGADRVGVPVGPTGLDSYRPGACAMAPFAIDRPAVALPTTTSVLVGREPADPVAALRRCRQPVPARVVVEAGRPVRVTSERRGFTGGSVVAAAGPWRTSGQWWEERTSAMSSASGPWDRDEWDVALSDYARYRVFRDRASDAWFIEGIFD